MMIQVCWIGCAVVTWSSGISCRHNGGSADQFIWRRTYRDMDGALLHGRGLLSGWSSLNVKRLLSRWSLLHMWLMCILVARKKNYDTWSDHTSVWITTNYQQIWHLFYQKHLKENFHRFKDCLIMSRWRGSRCHMTLPEFSCSSFFKEKLVLLFLNSQNPHIQKERQRTWCQRDSVKKCCFFF